MQGDVCLRHRPIIGLQFIETVLSQHPCVHSQSVSQAVSLVSSSEIIGSTKERISFAVENWRALPNINTAPTLSVSMG